MTLAVAVLAALTASAAAALTPSHGYAASFAGGRPIAAAAVAHGAHQDLQFPGMEAGFTVSSAEVRGHQRVARAAGARDTIENDLLLHVPGVQRLPVRSAGRRRSSAASAPARASGTTSRSSTTWRTRGGSVGRRRRRREHDDQRRLLRLAHAEADALLWPACARRAAPSPLAAHPNAHVRRRRLTSARPRPLACRLLRGHAARQSQEVPECNVWDGVTGMTFDGLIDDVAFWVGPMPSRRSSSCGTRRPPSSSRRARRWGARPRSSTTLTTRRRRAARCRTRGRRPMARRTTSTPDRSASSAPPATARSWGSAVDAARRAEALFVPSPIAPRQTAGSTRRSSSRSSPVPR